MQQRKREELRSRQCRTHKFANGSVASRRQVSTDTGTGAYAGTHAEVGQTGVVVVPQQQHMLLHARNNALTGQTARLLLLFEL